MWFFKTHLAKMVKQQLSVMTLSDTEKARWDQVQKNLDDAKQDQIGIPHSIYRLESQPIYRRGC